MTPPYGAVLSKLQPHIVEAAGLNVFVYPGTREDFSNNLVNLGMESCLIRFGLKFEGSLIDLDRLFYLVDVIKTQDGAVIFYNPESRVLDLKIIMRTRSTA